MPVDCVLRYRCKRRRRKVGKQPRLNTRSTWRIKLLIVVNYIQRVIAYDAHEWTVLYCTKQQRLVNHRRYPSTIHSKRDGPRELKGLELAVPGAVNRVRSIG